MRRRRRTRKCNDRVQMQVQFPGAQYTNSASRRPPLPLSPLTMLTTPAGSPASAHTCAKSHAERRVQGAGFSTTVFPMASAGATFQASMRRGKFHGMICPTTPTPVWPSISVSMSCAHPAWE